MTFEYVCVMLLKFYQASIINHLLPSTLKFKIPSPLHYIPTPLYYIPTPLHYIPTSLHYIPTPLHYIHTPLHYIPTALHYIPTLLHYIPTPLHYIPTPLHYIHTHFYMTWLVCFEQVEDKFSCSKSGSVRYVTRGELYLPLPVPLDEATNTQEVEQFKARKQLAEKKGQRL